LPAAEIVKGGRPAAVLVVPGPAGQAASAARRIRDVVAQMSGARLEVATEGAAVQNLLPIYVGPTRFAAGKGIRQEELKPEEIVLIATDRYAIVLGNEGPAGPSKNDTQRGTLFAAVELLERLGCRWLWPDPTGHVIPKTRDVILPNVEYRHAPKVCQRTYRLYTGMASHFPYVVAKYGKAPNNVPLYDWELYARLGGSRIIKAGHSFGDWYQRFFKSHPDYFATGPDGSFTWMHIKDRAKLCVSNPQVTNQIVADALAAYKSWDHPTLGTYSIAPNDGQGFCLCPNCKAMDNPHGHKESWIISNPSTGRREVVTHVSLTDRYLKFWNGIAERLDDQTPGMILGTLAYSVYRYPPLDVKQAHPKIAIGMVGGTYTNENQRRLFLDHWRQWSKVCQRMFWRPNFMKEGEGFPLVWATKMGNDIKALIHNGMIGAEFPNIHHHWGTQGLNYYVTAKMLWDDTLDPSAIIDDYCRKGFGAAAPAVRRYVARLEELTDRFAKLQGELVTDYDEAQADDEDPDASKPKGATGKQEVSAWEDIWSDTAFHELEAMLKQAASAVEAGTPEATRVAILREGLDFAKLEVQVRRAIDLLGTKADEDDLLLAIARLEQWMQTHSDSKAVGVVQGAPYWWRGKRDVKLISSRQPTVMGTARHIAGNKYLLTVPGYGMTGRFVSIQFSADGRTWSRPEPYKVDHQYAAPGAPRPSLSC
jgi:hypothetical protein